MRRRCYQNEVHFLSRIQPDWCPIVALNIEFRVLDYSIAPYSGAVCAVLLAFLAVNLSEMSAASLIFSLSNYISAAPADKN